MSRASADRNPLHEDAVMRALEEPTGFDLQHTQSDLEGSTHTPPGTQTVANADIFARIATCTPEEIELVAHILELRGAQPRQAKMRRTCLDAAGITKGQSVIEIGAGTGVIARDVARVIGETGRVVALDPSKPLLDYARNRPPMAGETPIEWVEGWADRLPFADGEFEVSLAITLLCHLTDQRAALAEMKRVTRKGGKMMLFDQDYQTLVFAHSDTALTRRILLHGADYNVVDGWCGRKLSGMLARLHLRNVKCWPFVYSERDASSYLITIAQRFAKLARTHGIITPQEHSAWVGELHDRAAEGTFYGSLNYYFAFGET